MVMIWGWFMALGLPHDHPFFMCLDPHTYVHGLYDPLSLFIWVDVNVYHSSEVRLGKSG